MRNTPPIAHRVVIPLDLIVGPSFTSEAPQHLRGEILVAALYQACHSWPCMAVLYPWDTSSQHDRATPAPHPKVKLRAVMEIYP